MRIQPVILGPNGRPAREPIRARYNAAYQSPARGVSLEYLEDSSQDLGGWSLDKLSELSRYLYKNSPFIRGIFERITTFVWGTGINPVPATSSEDWNKRAQRVWKSFSERSQINSRAPWGKTGRQIFREMLLDGNEFVLLTESKQSGFPRIQVIRYHRLKRIEKDKTGRATDYVFSVRNRDGSTKDVSYPSDEVVHFSNGVFSDSLLGEPLLACALNTGIDVQEIIDFEKIAVKEASKTTSVISTETGEAPTAERLLSDATGDEDDPVSYYHRTWGPEQKVIRRGDSIEWLQHNRPGPAWQGMMEWLVNSITLATNFPPSVLLGSKMGGADSRRDIASAARTVEQWQGDIVPDMARIYVHALQPEVDGGVLQGAPSEWKSAISWQTPKSISVDYGREAAQDREDIKLGLGTRREYFGRWGQDWREEEAQTDIEARSLIDRAKKISEEKKIGFEVALKLLSDRGIEPQPQAPPQQDGGATP